MPLSVEKDLWSFIEIQKSHIRERIIDVDDFVLSLDLITDEEIVVKKETLKENVKKLSSYTTLIASNDASEEVLLDYFFSILSSFRTVYYNLKDIEYSLVNLNGEETNNLLASRASEISTKVNENLTEQEDAIRNIEVRLSSLEKYITMLTAYNLFPEGAASQIKNGISVTPTGVGSFILDGRPTAWTSYNLCRYTNSLPKGLYPGEEYYISFRETPKGSTYYIQYYENGNNSPVTMMTLSETYRSGKFVLPENAIGFRIWVHMSPTYCICKQTQLEVSLVSTKSPFYSNLLIEDNHPTPKAPLPILTIIDDDGYKKFMKFLLPIIQEKQIPIASSVPTAEVGVIDKVMTWDEIVECASYGAEILSHTHSNLSRGDAEGMSINEIAYDYRRSQYILRTHGFKSETLVFVGDSSNDPNCIEACKQVFQNGIKAGTNKTNYYGTTNRYQINRWSINPSDSVEKLKGKIDELLEENTGWMIWMIHTSSGEFQQPFADVLSEVIDYALDKGLVIGTTEYGISQYCAE